MIIRKFMELLITNLRLKNSKFSMTNLIYGRNLTTICIKSKILKFSEFLITNSTLKIQNSKWRFQYGRRNCLIIFEFTRKWWVSEVFWVVDNEFDIENSKFQNIRLNVTSKIVKFSCYRWYLVEFPLKKMYSYDNVRTEKKNSSNFERSLIQQLTIKFVVLKFQLVLFTPFLIDAGI